MTPTTPTDEMLMLAEVLGDVKARTEKLETEFATQSKPLEGAAEALAAALAGIKALQFHVLDNSLGALAAKVDEHRSVVDSKIAIVVDELKKADDLSALASSESVAAVCAELAEVRAQLWEFARKVERVELEAKREMQRELQSFAAIPGPRGEAGRSLQGRGVWEASPDTPYMRGDIVSYLGSSYMSNEDDNTEKPGPKAKKWTLMAQRGGISLSGESGSAALVTFPASATAAGASGSVAYSNGYAALCVAANTWVFWPTTSDYPF